MLLIDQVNYSSTPTYNFPSLLEDHGFSEKLIEASIISLESITGKKLRLYVEDSISSDEDITEATITVNSIEQFKVYTLKPIREPTSVVGVDTSSIKIGETENGIIYAFRGTIVWRSFNNYKYIRIGPLPFHITEENKNDIYNTLKRYYLGLNFSRGAPNVTVMQSRICSLLEYWLQKIACRMVKNSLILWDGSLIANPGDCSSIVLPDLLKFSRRKSNVILAFSKVSKLRVLGKYITDLVFGFKPPCLLEVRENSIPSLNPLKILGRIYVAKFIEGPFIFRLDVDKNLDSEEVLCAVGKLIWNDLMFQGYPETLRLAHILSTFTATEVMAIQKFISETYGLKIVAKPDIRKLLFGPYGTGLEGLT